MEPRRVVSPRRLWLGGLVAAATLWVLTGLVNALLGAEFQLWAAGMGDKIHPPAPAVALGLWSLMSLLYGWVGVWLATWLPGPRIRVALTAGLWLWVVTKLATAFDLLALGVLPPALVGGELLGSLGALVLSTLAGTWMALGRGRSSPSGERS